MSFCFVVDSAVLRCGGVPGQSVHLLDHWEHLSCNVSSNMQWPKEASAGLKGVFTSFEVFFDRSKTFVGLLGRFLFFFGSVLIILNAFVLQGF